MVYFRNAFISSAPLPFTTRLLEDSGFGMVSSSPSMSADSFNIRTPNSASWVKNAVSIVICTYGRPESLNDTLQSLTSQTFRNFEVILITEKGDLSKLRDKGLKCSSADIVIFIDDDVYCPSGWLQSVFESFREGVVGVSGPTQIPSEYRDNRDIIKFRWIKELHDTLFLGKEKELPGFLSSCGTPSLASSNGTCKWYYRDDIDYLEACNMATRRKEAIDCGGFDPRFSKTSEGCEVDLALRLKARGRLVFTKEARLLHKPSQKGIYGARLDTRHRWNNFIYFQKKWEEKGVIKRNFRTYAYRTFVWIYLTLKNLRMI